MDVVENSLRQKLHDPDRLLLPPHRRGELPPKNPKVWADHATWVKVARSLLHCNIGLAVPDGTQRVVDGRVIEHGCFGVGKGGHDRGCGPQRFVINMPLVNALLETLVGDMECLPPTNS